MEGLTPESAYAYLKAALDTAKAELLINTIDRPFKFQTITLDLSTARLSTDPYKISTQFKGLYVIDGTDINASVNLKPLTQDSYQSSVPLKLNSSLNFDTVVPGAFIDWSAQSGKTLTLLLLVDGSFKTGQIISANGGGVSINDGASFTRTVVTLSAATAGALAASSGLRKVATIQNNTGSDVWVGESSVTNAGATTGIKISSGSTFIWRNTAALYGYSVAGGSLVVLEEF